VETYKITFSGQDLCGNVGQEQVRDVNVVTLADVSSIDLFLDLNQPYHAIVDISGMHIITYKGDYSINNTSGINLSIARNESLINDMSTLQLNDICANVDVSLNVDNKVNIPTSGTYIVTYTGKDISNHAILKIEPTVIIELTGDRYISINQGTVYSELGARVKVRGFDLRAANVTGTVDIYTSGTYIITYNGVDTSGNAGAEKTREVLVVDTKPVIILNGGDISLNQGTTYYERGARIIDAGKDFSGADISGTVDVNNPGLYEIIYTGSDSCGNLADPVRRYIQIIDTKPIIILNGEPDKHLIKERVILN
jgi:hypothetical protein